ncbi:flagellar hook capping FlgD N-terminal domain-containing protein [Alicyclobacillus ferrooxydans]|uniref:Flagellar hook capping protein n=1 Tax=Alicyclobacillus ferrooxydans TaxID=471514 RepID=A0A0P9CFM7_9BACL|nr:flagellar hook capping FlgD N-terminal domain-containing protein [Alicyclobacillus ferrooxydans]KPV44377.1 hypothetical protein AN477_07015 [Alicyclobacillus ferrooxydans]
MTTPIPAQMSSVSTALPSGVPANPNGQLTENSFLQMMVTQMQYQDPLSSSSTSGTQMLSQLSQYAQIEALTNLEQIAQSIQSALGMSMGAQILGKTATVTDSSGNAVTGTVTSVKNSNGTSQIEINNNYYPTSSVTQIG